MKTLIIHPEDPTTTFLSQVYAKLKNKTVVRGGLTKLELQELIESHDRVLMLGHGSPYGLMNPDQFPDAGLYIIDDSMVLPLSRKSNIFIWCYANIFVQKHELSGLCTGMFISEVREANSYCFENVDENLIDQSNERFSWIISNNINQPIEILYKNLLNEYKLLAKNNPIARFNLQRIQLAYSWTNERPLKVVTNEI